jgi:hypothetical protein
MIAVRTKFVKFPSDGYKIFQWETDMTLQLQIPINRLNSISLFPDSYPSRLASRNSSQFYTVPASFWTLLYNHFARTTQKTYPLCFWEGVFTAHLHSSGSYSIVSCIFVVPEIYLPSRCLVMNACCDITIPAFERHVTSNYWRIDSS